jgi:hypothetical protein
MSNFYFIAHSTSRDTCVSDPPARERTRRLKAKPIHAAPFIMLGLLFWLVSFAQLSAQKSWDHGAGTNNWGDGNNWSPNGVPASTDAVTIPNNSNAATIIVNVNAVGASLSFTGGNQPALVSINPGISLTISGAISLNAPSDANENKIMAVGEGSLSCASISMASTINDNRDCRVTVSTGTVTVSGNISMSGSAARNQFTFTGAGTLNIGGSITGGDLITFTGSTVNYNGAAQNVRGATYHHLTLSGSATKTLSGATASNGTVAINNGATLATANLALTFGGDFINNGTFTAGSSNITITGGLTQSIAGFTTTGNVIGAKSGSDQVIASFTGAVNGAHLNLNSPNNQGGRINLCANTTNIFTNWTQGFTILGVGGDGVTLRITGTSTAVVQGYFYQGNSTVEFTASGPQTVACVEYWDLKLCGSGVKTMQFISDGPLTLPAIDGTLFMEGTATANVAPIYLDNAKLIYNTATARMAGPEWITPFTTMQWWGGTSGGVTIANTGAITLNENKTICAGIPLTINDGSTLCCGESNYTLTLCGDFINNGTFTPCGGTVTFGGDTQTIEGDTSPLLFNNVVISSTNAVTLNTDAIISGQLDVGDGHTLIVPAGRVLTVGGE